MSKNIGNRIVHLYKKNDLKSDYDKDDKCVQLNVTFNKELGPVVQKVIVRKGRETKYELMFLTFFNKDSTEFNDEISMDTLDLNYKMTTGCYDRNRETGMTFFRTNFELNDPQELTPGIFKLHINLGFGAIDHFYKDVWKKYFGDDNIPNEEQTYRPREGNRKDRMFG